MPAYNGGPLEQPRFFALKDPAAGLDLVVEAPTHSGSTSAKSSLAPMSIDEEVLYVSPSSEMLTVESEQSQLVIIVTTNATNGQLSVWQAIDVTRGQQSKASVKRTRNRVSGSAKCLGG